MGFLSVFRVGFFASIRFFVYKGRTFDLHKTSICLKKLDSPNSTRLRILSVLPLVDKRCGQDLLLAFLHNMGALALRVCESVITDKIGSLLVPLC